MDGGHLGGKCKKLFHLLTLAALHAAVRQKCDKREGLGCLQHPTKRLQRKQTEASSHTSLSSMRRLNFSFRANVLCPVSR
jgi:hypothetical protein